MSAIYELIGRLVVRFVLVRYRRQIRIAAGIGLVTALVGGYLALTREPEEG